MMPSPAPATAPCRWPSRSRRSCLTQSVVRCSARAVGRAETAAPRGERDASLLDLGLSAGVERARVPLLGDGDLSYAVALASCDDCRESRVELTATTFEPDEQLFARYARARENARLLARRGARVMHGVDATERDTWRDGEWDRIVWNFPHHPDRRKVQKHRQLLRSFFAAAAPVVGHADGEVWVTLMAGQGGTASERPGTARRWEDSWQIVAQAAAADLVLVRVHAVGEGELASLRGLGYGAVGFRSQDRAFRTAGALTHVFARALRARGDPLGCRGRAISFWIDGRGRRASFARRAARGGSGIRRGRVDRPREGHARSRGRERRIQPARRVHRRARSIAASRPPRAHIPSKRMRGAFRLYDLGAWMRSATTPMKLFTSPRE